MSDTTGPNADPVETSVTEPLQLADQHPIEPVVAAAPVKKSSTRTILEVVGGVVAVGLIALAGVVGFALGHFTSDGNDRGGFSAGHFDDQNRSAAGGTGGGQGMMPGQPGQQGVDPRGIDPDGDNWTGGGQGMMPGQPGTAPTAPQQNANPSASPSSAA